MSIAVKDGAANSTLRQEYPNLKWTTGHLDAKKGYSAMEDTTWWYKTYIVRIECFPICGILKK